MKIKLLNLAVATVIATGVFGLAQAADQNQLTDKQQMQQLLVKTDKLEKELATLKAQLRQESYASDTGKAGKMHGKMRHSKALATGFTRGSSHQASEMGDNDEISKLLAATRYAHGFSVITSPFLGQYDVYSIGNLIVNVPSTNADLHLLEQRKKFEDYSTSHGEPINKYAVLDFSGAIEAQANFASQGNFINDSTLGAGNTASKTDINLSRVELDTVAELGPWVTGAMMINYEKASPLTTTSATPGSRINNSRVKVDRAFITIGNLNRFPVFGTVGQVTVPFGNYMSYELSDPMTVTVGKTKERAAELSFNKWDLYGTLYAFKGDSYVNNSNVVNNWGANLGYKLQPLSYLTTDFGVSYIANIADSMGMQNAMFGRTGVSSTAEQLDHAVPGADAHLVLNMKPFTVASEYVSAMRHFAATDLSYNGMGARPQAFEVEGAYAFKMFDKNSNLAVGYNRSWQALGLQLPQQSYFAVVNTALWPYTIESLEYRHDINYADGDTGAGKATTFSPAAHSQNVVTLQIGAYF